MAILITGATGHLGSYICLGLLNHTIENLVLLVREHHSSFKVLSYLKNLLETEGVSDTESLLQRVSVLTIPVAGMTTESTHKLIHQLQDLEIREIIHSAGCLDYFNKEKLTKTNIGFTQEMLIVGKELGIRRFIFISTAFSQGYSEEAIPEKLHQGPAEDPTLYTQSKREAEWVVARSEIPFLIIRPSIVIGDSRYGNYQGKPYGIYQFTEVYKKIFCNSYLPKAHLVASEIPLNLLHQDSFLQGFIWGYRLLPDRSVFNLVSRPEHLPTPRDIFNIWMEICVHPHEVYYYSSSQEVPVLDIDPRLKMLLEISKVNTNIASREWKFETKNLSWLIEQGCPFVDTSLETVYRCMKWVADNSPEIQGFLRNYRGSFPSKIKVIDYSRNKIQEKILQD